MIALALAACTGTPSPVGPAIVVDDAFSDELIDASWPLLLATKSDQDALTNASPGWESLIAERRYEQATTELGALGGLPAARAHADQAALYRQAAMIAAWSYIVTYEQTAEPTDPLGTAHLLSVSFALTGDLERAREQDARLAASPDDPTTPWQAPWRAWLAQPEPLWPPDLSALPLGLPAPTIGASPTVPFPNYRLVDGAGASFDLADPGSLVALALWHDRAAHVAAGADGAAVDTYLARYHFPVEPDVIGVDLPFEFLIGSDFLVPADGPFVADLMGAAGPSAVHAWADRSLLAAMAERSRRPDWTFSGELAADHAADLREQLLARSLEANGEVTGAHRLFADVAEAGTLRSLAFVPEIEVRRRVEESGRLRILAKERADIKRPTACPEGLLSLAAWDAGNGYTLRGSDIVHGALRRYPSVEVSQYALDVLALRMSRQRTSPGPQP